MPADIAPWINTMIAEFSSRFIRIGYAGDVHPLLTLDTPSAFKTEPISFICTSLEKYLQMFFSDSLIFIQNPTFTYNDKVAIAKFLFVNKICQSIFFLPAPLADTFGFGKVSGMVVSCGASATTVSTIINGTVVESESTYPIQRMCGDRELEEELTVEIVEALLPVFDSIIDIVIANRTKYSINKKNAANGCIILTGGVFRFEPFFCLFRQKLLERIGEDFSDFVLREKELNSTFVGASLFGMNDQTKPLFITIYDWHTHGVEALKLKQTK
ncbi:hypothetical protein GINT2_002074 [Glugoides intestinalis]